MFASLQTLRTHCLHFQYDVSNVPSHTEHVKRSLETSKIEKKAKICWFSGFAAITKRKNRKVPLSPRGINIFQNPFNSIFVNLNANLSETSKSKRGLGEEKLRFLCFFWSLPVLKTVNWAKQKVLKHVLSKNGCDWGQKNFRILISKGMEGPGERTGHNSKIRGRYYDFVLFFLPRVSI